MSSWLMPVYEQGVLHSVGSPYCIKDFKVLNTQYGTLSELKTLVSTAQGKGMKVIFDWVANHTSWDNVWIANKSWYTQDANGNIISPEGFNWDDVADLNYNNADTRKAMLDAMKYWITEVNIDGYRCDYAEGVPHDFWQQAIRELKALKGNSLFMLAEGGDNKLFADGFNMVYGWNFASQLQQVYTGKSTLTKLYEVHKAEYVGVGAGQQRMRYSTNHDPASENSPIQEYRGERGAISAYVIAATLGGSPMIYSSQEIGYARPLSFFTPQTMDWNSNPAYRNEYEQIMAIRKASSALKTGMLKTYETGAMASYYRSDNQEGILVLVNTTNNTHGDKSSH
ncbi:alpha-amylase family glycosyl hydrolase [Bacteroides sp. BFG-551]|nr:alpha-amylase family glycosyl hydrolase [Bacteroides sp. BFG-551]